MTQIKTGGNMDNRKLQGHLAVGCANLFFGLNIPVTKGLLSEWMTPAGYMLVRASCAALLFWAAGCLLKREHVERKDMLLLLLGSLLGFVLSQFLTAVALEYTTPVYFSLITALSPVIVMLLASLFLKEPITGHKTIGVILGVAGALLLILNADTSGEAGKSNLLGIMLAVISVTAYSVYLIIMRTVSPKYSPVTQMKWTYLFAFIILLPFCLPSLPQQRLFTSPFSWEGYGELAFIIFFSTIIGYTLVPMGMKYLRATTVSVYMNLQPVVASLAAILVGQDTFSWDKPAAALLVIIGAYVVTTSPARGDIPVRGKRN